MVLSPLLVRYGTTDMTAVIIFIIFDLLALHDATVPVAQDFGDQEWGHI